MSVNSQTRCAVKAQLKNGVAERVLHAVYLSESQLKLAIVTTHVGPEWLGRQCVGLAVLRDAALRIRPSSEPSSRGDFP